MFFMLISFWRSVLLVVSFLPQNLYPPKPKKNLRLKNAPSLKLPLKTEVYYYKIYTGQRCSLPFRLFQEDLRSFSTIPLCHSLISCFSLQNPHSRAPRIVAANKMVTCTKCWLAPPAKHEGVGRPIRRRLLYWLHQDLAEFFFFCKLEVAKYRFSILLAADEVGACPTCRCVTFPGSLTRLRLTGECPIITKSAGSSFKLPLPQGSRTPL